MPEKKKQYSVSLSELSKLYKIDKGVLKAIIKKVSKKAKKKKTKRAKAKSQTIKFDKKKEQEDNQVRYMYGSTPFPVKNNNSVIDIRDAQILSEKIKIQVQQAIENYNLSLKQNLVYEQAIGQATENYRIVKDKYDNGLSNTTDLLEADVVQLNSKINYAYSRANIMLKYYEMQSASGQLTQSFQLTKN